MTTESEASQPLSQGILWLEVGTATLTRLKIHIGSHCIGLGNTIVTGRFAVELLECIDGRPDRRLQLSEMPTVEWIRELFSKGENGLAIVTGELLNELIGELIEIELQKRTKTDS